MSELVGEEINSGMPIDKSFGWVEIKVREPLTWLSQRNQFGGKAPLFGEKPMRPARDNVLSVQTTQLKLSVLETELSSNNWQLELTVAKNNDLIGNVCYRPFQNWR